MTNRKLQEAISNTKEERNRVKMELGMELSKVSQLTEDLEKAKRELNRLRSKNMMLNFKLDGANGQCRLIKDEKLKEIAYLEEQLEKKDTEIYNLRTLLNKKEDNASPTDYFHEEETPSLEVDNDDNIFDLTLLEQNESQPEIIKPMLSKRGSFYLRTSKMVEEENDYFSPLPKSPQKNTQSYLSFPEPVKPTNETTIDQLKEIVLAYPSSNNESKNNTSEMEEETIIKDISGTRMSPAFLKQFEEMNKELINKYESSLKNSTKIVEDLQENNTDLRNKLSLLESKINMLEATNKEQEDEIVLLMTKLTEVKLEYADVMNKLSKYIKEKRAQARLEGDSSRPRQDSASDLLKVLGFQ